MSNPLDLLKKDWNKPEANFEKFGQYELQSLLHRRSSNIVKWLFYISIAELVFWPVISLFTPKENWVLFSQLNLISAIWAINVVHYAIILYFIYRFYKNYQSIKATDSVFDFMNNIVRTRKIVKFYVIYNLTVMGLIFLFFNIEYFFNQDVILAFMEKSYGKISDPAKFMKYFFIAQIVIGVVFLLLLWLFYKLIYGILLRRLNKNYKELKKMMD
ncbi:MAG: hypothetical protein CO119_08010 [Flavobacteriales bacterium CG_4_9_14_3_um_filter_40_17]|nr:MAG: hypothetical protein CO119_08010 [Flavobacteriales bacterium CG_4_9_14_3_um_filter_40_17]